jgi:hypothetical protein
MTISSGLDLKESSVLILGLARNVSDYLESEIISLTHALSDFGKIGMFIVESDSEDSTVSVLNSLSGRFSNFSFVSLGKLSASIPNRVDRITYCRNRYITELENNSDFENYDYVVVADLDGVNADLTPEAIRSCWLKDGWAAVAANQSAPYYDIYALRHPTWSPNDCWLYEEELRGAGLNPVAAREKAIYARQIRIPQSSAWIEVDSAFGGFCIYKREAILGCRYASYTEAGEPVCEHVELHKQVTAKGGKIFINPSLINSGWNMHNTSMRIDKYIKRRIKLLAWILIPAFRRRGF